MYKVDLNSDLGESFGNYTCGNDAEVLKLISSANIACGFHASDPNVMMNTVKTAAECGTRIGAHPGFNDLQGFGRREIELSREEIKALIIYQVGALNAFCRGEGVKMQHVKPHGALYNMASKRMDIAEAICRGIKAADPELVVMGQYGGCLIKAAEHMGLRTACEVFADRAYEEDGTLVSRKKPGAMIIDADEAAARVIKMIKYGKVTAISGREITVRADTVCIHGDSPKALEFARTIREALQREKVIIKSIL